ncbi:MAG: hypothetical protein ACRCTE_03075, partial [Cellulosilyticaceae bacterium]
PYLYRDARTAHELKDIKNQPIETYWEKCRFDPNIEDDQRENTVAIKLNWCYHYHKDVVRRGHEPIIFKVDKTYVQCVKVLQREMQKYIAGKGIAIETNPSSNYLISNFRRYDKHPILNFYNQYLTHDMDQLKSCVQLPVCINTDDQGIFGTLLENEYALMACALEKVVDDDGNKVYTPTMIYEWLDKIREMGLQVSFSNNRREQKHY